MCLRTLHLLRFDRKSLSDIQLRDALEDSTDSLAKKVHEIAGGHRADAEAHDQAKHLWNNAPSDERAEQSQHKWVREHEGKAPAGGKKGDEGWREQVSSEYLRNLCFGELRTDVICSCARWLEGIIRRKRSRSSVRG